MMGSELEQKPIEWGRQDAVLSSTFDRLPPPRSLRAETGRGVAINPTRWLHEMLGRCQRALGRRGGMIPADRLPPAALRELGPPAAANYQPLRRVLLTTGVARTLFHEYSAHRRSDRGDEETGWVLLGWRDEDDAVVRATLPAGADREAGEAHVRFNSTVQAVASLIVRQSDRKLTMLGVVHTHPGSLRHPSDGDFRGDIQWVGQLRGGEGLFGIGTADGKYTRPGDEPWRPRPNMTCRGSLSFTWYGLRDGDRNYRAMPTELIEGPDLAANLRSAWDVLEDHAVRLERLARQQARLAFEVLPNGLAALLPLADGPTLRATLTKEGVRYFLLRDGQPLATDLHEPRVDRGVYQLLAELAGDGD
jgi:proteasome lid subunit RPN8/RPN11